jgi:hypothetical protein
MAYWNNFRSSLVSTTKPDPILRSTELGYNIQCHLLEFRSVLLHKAPQYVFSDELKTMPFQALFDPLSITPGESYRLFGVLCSKSFQRTKKHQTIGPGSEFHLAAKLAYWPCFVPSNCRMKHSSLLQTCSRAPRFLTLSDCELKVSSIYAHFDVYED